MAASGKKTSRASAAGGVKILSFNIENFSKKKYENQDVVNVLLEIVKDYDLVLLLEMEDHDVVLTGLVDQLNSTYGGNFAGLKSGPLSKAGRPEEYAFIYRKDRVKILKTFQYESDVYSRPPFTILVKAIETGLTFFVVPIHTKPLNTAVEIDALPDVFKSAARHFKTDAGVIMGDLNCGAEYVSRKKYDELSLVRNSVFHWWIGYDTDTTTKRGHSGAFDRIITHKGLTKHVVEGSVQVVKFDQELSLSYIKTRQVSDHYPVTFTLK